MSDLTVEQRLERLEDCVNKIGKKLHIETDTNKWIFMEELRIRDCPVCKHKTIQIFESSNEEFYCLNCGHTLGERIVAIN